MGLKEEHMEQQAISPILSSRIRRGIELTVCILFGWSLIQYGPLWYWPPVPAISVAVLATVVGLLVYRAIVQQLQKVVWGKRPGEAAPRPIKAYHVPRRFSIGAIGLVTLIIAALMATLQFLTESLDAELRAVVIGGLFTFLTVISLMQIIMQRVPRGASMIVGALCGLSLSLYAYPLSMSLSGTLVGGVCGYVGGVFVASIFLIADQIVAWWQDEPSDKQEPSTR